ncbi:MAG: sel1 repeat family protein [Polyangiaceae bacterium]|nr:sel1 repeat family protein [Polyangiaceae bacterium]
MPTVRLPLHIGVDALWRAAWASALLLPGAVLVATSVHLDAAHQARIVLGVIGAVALCIGIALIVYAWSARASDAVFGADGMGIEGGRHGGTTLRWEEIAAARIHADAAGFGHQLKLTTRTGQTLVLADAVDATEIASLESLGQTLKARLGEEPEPLPRRADLACCARCGAPLPPTDQQSISCIACGAPNPVDPRIRERVTMQMAADRTQQATALRIERLLRQPGANMASVTLALAALVSALVWAAVAAAFWIVGSDALDAFAIGVGFFNGWVFTFAMFSFARIALARRRALLLLSTTFGARPPVKPGDAPGCRQCGAPLPVGGSVLVGCIYCGTQSVLGINVRPLLRRVQQHGHSIEKLLGEQAAERSSWIKLGLIGVLATGIGALVLMAQIVVAQEFAEERASCERGVVKACADVGLSYYVGSSVREDKAAAFRYRKRACDGDHAEACRDIAFQLELGIGVPKDREQAKAHYEKACRLGFAKACDERKELDE